RKPRQQPEVAGEESREGQGCGKGSEKTKVPAESSKEAAKVPADSSKETAKVPVESSKVLEENKEDRRRAKRIALEEARWAKEAEEAKKKKEAEKAPDPTVKKMLQAPVVKNQKVDTALRMLSAKQKEKSGYLMRAVNNALKKIPEQDQGGPPVRRTWAAHMKEHFRQCPGNATGNRMGNSCAKGSGHHFAEDYLEQQEGEGFRGASSTSSTEDAVSGKANCYIGAATDAGHRLPPGVSWDDL
ncbi:unnamed protein product, partial [Symbiodinium sp. KB8]